MKKAQDSHYALMGWEASDGLPGNATLKKYGLDFVIQDMRKK
jgi:aldehyde:ferredoxin oxidoreductase